MEQGQEFELYQGHLNRVSRSFALCIARLNGPLRKWVSLTYLICRILDTVEDARWKYLSPQLKSFETFDRFILSAQNLRQVAHWVSEFPSDISEGEKLLLNDSEKLLADLHAGPQEFRRPIQDLVRSMSAGMRHFAKQKTSEGLRLQGLKQVNQYCFFVAGIVGETLSKLLAAVDSNVTITKDLLIDAHNFGLFLQKVNLLKDQVEDESDGRFLIPSRDKIYASLSQNAKGAMRYIESIPALHKDFRIFCLWSLFLGLKTLPLIQSGSAIQANLKIDREETMKLFALIEENANNTEGIRQAFSLLCAEAGFDESCPLEKTESEESQWISNLYNGDLSREDFMILNMA